jgi:Domain of unknown function DUF29
MMDDRPSGTKRRVRRAQAGYEQDLYSWAREQSALLRAGRVAEADMENIAEEIEDVGSEQYEKLESALRVILLHMLKWDHQPARRSRSWRASILVQRNQLQRLLKKNPGLKARIREALRDAYADARIMAAAQKRLDERGFPAHCPYSLQEVTDRPITWPAGG